MEERNPVPANMRVAVYSSAVRQVGRLYGRHKSLTPWHIMLHQYNASRLNVPASEKRRMLVALAASENEELLQQTLQVLLSLSLSMPLSLSLSLGASLCSPFR